MSEQVDLHVVELAGRRGVAQQRLSQRALGIDHAIGGSQQQRRHRVIHQMFADAGQVGDGGDSHR